jgi:hypothetical protein
LSSSLRELRKPALRLENALSVGARIVIPLFVVFSSLFNSVSSVVACIRRAKTVKWPAFCKILLTSTGPGDVATCADGACEESAGGAFTGVLGGAIAGAAAGDWHNVFVQWRKKKIRDNTKMKDCGLILK